MKLFNLKYAAMLAATATLFLTSCGKDDDDDVVNPVDEITITAPTDGAIVNAGQSVAITGTITGKHEIHGYSLFVRQKTDGKVLFTKDVHDHSSNIAINETWAIDTVAKHKELELEVRATLDHDGNTMSKKITLHALPAGVHNLATISIASPMANQMVTSNQAITIQATISGLATIHGYKLFIRKKSDSTVLFTKDVHEHATNITVSETWTVPVVTAHTDLELEVVATLDHDGNTFSQKVDFHAMP